MAAAWSSHSSGHGLAWRLAPATGAAAGVELTGVTRMGSDGMAGPAAEIARRHG